MSAAIQVYDGEGSSVKAAPKLIDLCRRFSAELPVLARAQDHAVRLNETLQEKVSMSCFQLGGAYTLLQHEDVGQLTEGFHLALQGLAGLSNYSESEVVRAGANMLLRLSTNIVNEMPT